MKNKERFVVEGKHERLGDGMVASFVETLEAWVNGHYPKYGVELYCIIEGFYDKNRKDGIAVPELVDEFCDSWNSFLLGAMWIGHEMAIRLSSDRLECLSMAISDELTLEDGSLLVFDMMKARKLKDERDIVAMYLKICRALDGMLGIIRSVR